MPHENHIVNPSFNIATENILSGKQNLFVQAGKQGISFIQLDTDSSTFTSVQVYHFAKNLTENNIAEEINLLLRAENLLQQHFKKIYVTWCFDENILVPNEYYDSRSAKEMLELVYGDAVNSTIQNDLVIANNLHTVYKIPFTVKNVFTACFPFSIQSHQNSLVINFDIQHRDLLYCNFYPNNITVLLRMNGQLQIIQNFDFSTPEDAVYHLLNVCQSFETDALQTNLIVSGMIDADSNLYNELHKYFLNIEFATLPDKFSYVTEINNYPQHYFSHLFATASCVL